MRCFAGNGLEWTAMRMINKMKVTTAGTSVGMKLYSLKTLLHRCLHADYMCTAGLVWLAPHSRITKSYMVTLPVIRANSRAGSFISKSFPLMCTVFALFSIECIVEKICTTIQYKTLCQTKSISHRKDMKNSQFVVTCPRDLW